MKVNVDFKFDDGGLKKLQRNLEKLPKESEVPVSELFNDDFMKQYTDFQTFQAMVDASGIKNSDEIGNEAFSKFVSTHTRCGNWEDMKKQAGAEYVKRKLGL